jgi:hypothetical protein
LWSLVSFLALAKFGYFGSKYLESNDTWQATREAIAQIKTQGGVLTTTDVAPHVTHRPIVQLATEGSESMDLSQFTYVLLNLHHYGWGSSAETINTLTERLKRTPEFQLKYQRNGVFLFVKNRQ